MSKKILIVEDNKEQLMAWASQLKAVGYEVAAAQDAVTAITAARQAQPDLIVRDLGLPAGDGFVVLERLRTFLPLLTVPVIVLSARDPITNAKRARQAGARAYF